ncbi:DUF4344 domain-containing metallopeptidase [Thermoactinospora rubra]|uniref:DUF4344 domain-containing metallopeptidase n=1 Tax=Thermoactinospora rubra TaxID=1088767 RepID=UPI000A102EBB|nr:DUF4344 domain-containing metallopeptidase [Thermoactinospora rubra]
MKSILSVVVVLALASACGTAGLRLVTAPGASPAPGPSAPSLSTGAFRFTAAYVKAKDRRLRPAEWLMKDHELLQGWARVANDAFVPPRDVRIVAEQCGTVNAFYNSDDKSITMCYEMVPFLEELLGGRSGARDAEEAVVGTLNGIFYHEFGHALIDLYDLPVTGREEDAVDQLSALVLIAQAEESGNYTGVIAMMDVWGRLARMEEKGRLDRSAFADSHSLSSQRYYNVMCYLYGSDHNAFLPLVSDRLLPVDRAQGCEAEYERMAGAWARLLQPVMKDGPPTPGPSVSGASVPGPSVPGHSGAPTR